MRGSRPPATFRLSGGSDAIATRALQRTDRKARRVLGVGNSLRYAATTGTVAIRWDGARAPTIWTIAATKVDPTDACRKLARGYLHISGRRRRIGSLAGQGSPGAPRQTHSPHSRGPYFLSGHRLATTGSLPATSRLARRRDRAIAPAAERRCVLPARRGGARAPRTASRSPAAALDAPRVARRAPRRGRDLRNLETRAPQSADRGVGTPVA